MSGVVMLTIIVATILAAVMKRTTGRPPPQQIIYVQAVPADRDEPGSLSFLVLLIVIVATLLFIQ